jgi:probable biosynthetic protein (TIGR04098 family)
VTFNYEVTLGLPQTNRRGFWEPDVMKQAGHCQWQAIATALGRPLSELRTVSGGEIYAAFYYIESRVPDTAPLESFKLDDTVRFTIALRAFKNISIEGQVRMGIAGSLEYRALALVRFP